MQEILYAFGIDWRLIVIQVFNFTLLLAALWYFLYTPVLNVIRDRRKKVTQGIQDAEDAAVLKAEAQSERNTILTSAQKEAEQIIAGAKKAAQEKTEVLIAAADERADHIIADASKKGEMIKMNAQKESEAEIAKAAVLAAERLLNERA